MADLAPLFEKLSQAIDAGMRTPSNGRAKQAVQRRLDDIDDKYEKPEPPPLRVDINTSKVELALAKELVKRQLIAYFTNTKGLGDNLNAEVYPPALLDLTRVVPVLWSQVEIKPFVTKVDPILKVVSVGWNMFVRGVPKKFLGYTTHDNPAELKQAAQTGIAPPRPFGKDWCSAKSIIKFILRAGKFDFTDREIALLNTNPLIGVDIADGTPPAFQRMSGPAY